MKQPVALKRYWDKRRKSQKKRRVTTMKNGRPSKKRSFTIPLAIVAGVTPLAYDVGVQVRAGDFKQASMVIAHNVPDLFYGHTYSGCKPSYRHD